MREPITSQIELGQVQIADIKFNLKHRDDIPAVLMGLQALYMDEEIRKKVFEILKKRVRPQVDHNRGRGAVRAQPAESSAGGFAARPGGLGGHQDECALPHGCESAPGLDALSGGVPDSVG